MQDKICQEMLELNINFLYLFGCAAHDPPDVHLDRGVGAVTRLSLPWLVLELTRIN